MGSQRIYGFDDRFGSHIAKRNTKDYLVGEPFQDPRLGRLPRDENRGITLNINLTLNLDCLPRDEQRALGAAERFEERLLTERRALMPAERVGEHVEAVRAPV